MAKLNYTFNDLLNRPILEDVQLDTSKGRPEIIRSNTGKRGKTNSVYPEVSAYDSVNRMSLPTAHRMSGQEEAKRLGVAAVLQALGGLTMIPSSARRWKGDSNAISSTSLKKKIANFKTIIENLTKTFKLQSSDSIENIISKMWMSTDNITKELGFNPHYMFTEFEGRGETKLSNNWNNFKNGGLDNSLLKIINKRIQILLGGQLYNKYGKKAKADILRDTETGRIIKMSDGALIINDENVIQDFKNSLKQTEQGKKVINHYENLLQTSPSKFIKLFEQISKYFNNYADYHNTASRLDGLQNYINFYKLEKFIDPQYDIENFYEEGEKSIEQQTKLTEKTQSGKILDDDIIRTLKELESYITNTLKLEGGLTIDNIFTALIKADKYIKQVPNMVKKTDETGTYLELDKENPVYRGKNWIGQAKAALLNDFGLTNDKLNKENFPTLRDFSTFLYNNYSKMDEKLRAMKPRIFQKNSVTSIKDVDGNKTKLIGNNPRKGALGEQLGIIENEIKQYEKIINGLKQRYYDMGSISDSIEAWKNNKKKLSLTLTEGELFKGNFKNKLIDIVGYEKVKYIDNIIYDLKDKLISLNSVTEKEAKNIIFNILKRKTPQVGSEKYDISKSVINGLHEIDKIFSSKDEPNYFTDLIINKMLTYKKYLATQSVGTVSLRSLQKGLKGLPKEIHDKIFSNNGKKIKPIKEVLKVFQNDIILPLKKQHSEIIESLASFNSAEGFDIDHKIKKQETIDDNQKHLNYEIAVNPHILELNSGNETIEDGLDKTIRYFINKYPELLEKINVENPNNDEDSENLEEDNTELLSIYVRENGDNSILTISFDKNVRGANLSNYSKFNEHIIQIIKHYLNKVTINSFFLVENNGRNALGNELYEELMQIINYFLPESEDNDNREVLSDMMAEVDMMMDSLNVYEDILNTTDPKQKFINYQQSISYGEIDEIRNIVDEKGNPMISVEKFDEILQQVSNELEQKILKSKNEISKNMYTKVDVVFAGMTEDYSRQSHTDTSEFENSKYQHDVIPDREIGQEMGYIDKADRIYHGDKNANVSSNNKVEHTVKNKNKNNKKPNLINHIVKPISNKPEIEDETTEEDEEMRELCEAYNEMFEFSHITKSMGVRNDKQRRYYQDRERERLMSLYYQ